MMIETHKGTQLDLAGQVERLAAELGDLRAGGENRVMNAVAKEAA